MMELGDFLWRVDKAGSKTHAINPKTKKTYCGIAALELGPPEGKWRPLDVVPSDEHQPTCKICQRHYDDPLREQMRGIAKDLQESISEFLDTRCMLKDVDGLGRFVRHFRNFMAKERIRAINRKKLREVQRPPEKRR